MPFSSLTYLSRSEGQYSFPSSVSFYVIVPESMTAGVCRKPLSFSNCLPASTIPNGGSETPMTMRMKASNGFLFSFFEPIAKRIHPVSPPRQGSGLET